MKRKRKGKYGKRTGFSGIGKEMAWKRELNEEENKKSNQNSKGNGKGGKSMGWEWKGK